MEHLIGFIANALKELITSLMKVMRTFYLKFWSKHHFSSKDLWYTMLHYFGKVFVKAPGYYFNSTDVAVLSLFLPFWLKSRK